MPKAKLYLIPVPLGKTSTNNSLPPAVLDIVRTLTHFAVESMPTTLKFMQWVGKTRPIHECTFYELNKRTPAHEKLELVQILKEGHDLGVMTDAGCPAIADPGSDLAKLAHEADIEVVPLVGPNSMTLALMASGLGGQSYAFSGYLAVNEKERSKQISLLEKSSREFQRTELFMEAPHRNLELYKSLIRHLSLGTKLCIACNISLENEWIKTRSVEEWKKSAEPDINKKPCVFLLRSS